MKQKSLGISFASNPTENHRSSNQLTRRKIRRNGVQSCQTAPTRLSYSPLMTCRLAKGICINLIICALGGRSGMGQKGRIADPDWGRTLKPPIQLIPKLILGRLLTHRDRLNTHIGVRNVSQGYGYA
jgi:hypothetical protein